MDTSLQLEPNSQVLDSQKPNSQEPNSPEPPSQEPTFELPPGTLDFIPDEITPTKNLALSFIRERYRDTAPINTGASHLLAKVRIATTTGSHRRRQGTWKACCALRTQPATELVPPFAVLRPDTVSEDETPAKYAEVDSLEWPSDLSPSAGKVLDVELWMQRRPGRTQGSSQRTEFERTYFTRWKDNEETPWSQVQLFSSVDALQTYFRLVCHRHDILPLAGPDIDLIQKRNWTRWHWADFEIAEYYATTVGDGARAVRCDTIKTLHPNDDTVVTALAENRTEDEDLPEEDLHLIWAHAKPLRGNPPPSESICRMLEIMPATTFLSFRLRYISLGSSTSSVGSQGFSVE